MRLMSVLPTSAGENSFEGRGAEDTDWRTLGVSAEELAAGGDELNLRIFAILAWEV
jgi:hypothetical protein